MKFGVRFSPFGRATVERLDGYRILAAGASCGLLLALAACGAAAPIGKTAEYVANYDKESVEELPTTQPPAPHGSGPNQAIIDSLSCIKKSKKLDNYRFAIAVHADGTGKSANGYEGSTGSFLPQGTSAIWAAQAVMYAGGTAQNYYELNTERALRQFGGDTITKELNDRQTEKQPNFVISTAFTALDFVGGPDFDMRLSGIGPQVHGRGAALEVSAEIYRLGDRTTLAISSLQRQVRYNFVGLNTGTALGWDNKLLTGAISWTDQQKLQEATRDLIALSVADVLSRVPGVPEVCQAKVKKLVNSPKHGTDGNDEAPYVPSSESPSTPAPEEKKAPVSD